MADPATDVFLSYKAEDRSRVVPLVKALEAEGLTVWWDAHIGGGANWHEEIERHLDAARCVVVAWSKRSVGPEGDFVREEARRAQRKDAYVPVCIDGVEPPLGFGEIQAIPLKGWKGDRSDPRFHAVADAVRRHVSGEPISRSYGELQKPSTTRRAAIAGGIGVGVIALAGAGGWLLLRPSPANAKRIAVLPFANLSGSAEQTYFAEGIAEELRSALSRIGMEVIGRSSSVSVKDLDTKTAAEKLGVANILTGSVRRSSDLVRVNAQLVSGEDGVERWAQSYDRAPGDTIKIQTDIAANVALALDIVLGQVGRAAMALGGTADSVAQDLVMQARQLRRTSLGEESVEKSLSLVGRAIARDPNYALAYFERATLLIILEANYSKSTEQALGRIELADKAADKALAIAPTMGLSHLAKFGVEQARLNFADALQHYRKALALSPDDPDVHFFGPSILANLGEEQEAVRLADRLVILDPLNGRAHLTRSYVLYLLGQYPEAIAGARKVLEIEPELKYAYGTIGISLLAMGRLQEALAAFRNMPVENLNRMFGEMMIAARTGDMASAGKLASELRKHSGGSSYFEAQISAQLGQKERAFQELHKALSVRDHGLLSLKKDKLLDPLRSDPRYADLVMKLNFPS